MMRVNVWRQKKGSVCVKIMAHATPLHTSMPRKDGEKISSVHSSLLDYATKLKDTNKFYFRGPSQQEGHKRFSLVMLSCPGRRLSVSLDFCRSTPVRVSGPSLCHLTQLQHAKEAVLSTVVASA